MNLTTSKFKQLLADQFYKNATSQDLSTMHLVGAGIVPEETVSEPGDGVFATSYEIHDQILFGKRILPTDVSFMIRNIPWVSGNKYDMYDDKDNDVENKNFYVVSDQEDGSYGVFKCIYKNKNNDPVSIYKPLVSQTSPQDEIYITNDGYHWKYMFTIDIFSHTKFSTSSHVPVVRDSDVELAAVPGTIDSIVIENAGSSYNNYAFGRIKSINYNNNNLKVSIESDNTLEIRTYTVVYSSQDSFESGENVEISVDGVVEVTAQVYKTGTGTVSFELSESIRNIEQTENTVVTLSNGSITATVTSSRDENMPTISTNRGFYTGSHFYIRGGTGAGQLKTVTDYEVIGNDRVITLDSSFETPLDLSSNFSILPRITIKGDGQGALAIPEIDTNANTISDIQIINRGSNYTFADVEIFGNSGVINSEGSPVIADSAELRAIITPSGGHGSDPVNELYANNVGISVRFDKAEVLENVSYSKIAIIKDLLHNNIILTLDSLLEGDYSIGDTVYQDESYGTISEINASDNTITLTDVYGDFSVGTMSENVEIIDINRSTDTFNNDILLDISPISSSFSIGEIVTQNNSNAKGIVINSSTSNINIVEVIGTFTNDVSSVLVGETTGARALITSVETKKTVYNSGEVIYVENFSQIERSDETTEQMKLVFKF